MEFLLECGYWGMFAGAFLAATVVPLAPDFLLMGLLLAGADPIVTVVSASLGNWLGAMTSYGLGRLGKWEWIERWLKVSRARMEQHKVLIDRYGSILALFTWLPFIGDVITIGLGFYRTQIIRVSIFILIGKSARFIFWTLLFIWFGIEPII